MFTRSFILIRCICSQCTRLGEWLSQVGAVARLAAAFVRLAVRSEEYSLDLSIRARSVWRSIELRIHLDPLELTLSYRARHVAVWAGVDPPVQTTAHSEIPKDFFVELVGAGALWRGIALRCVVGWPINVAVCEQHALGGRKAAFTFPFGDFCHYTQQQDNVINVELHVL